MLFFSNLVGNRQGKELTLKYLDWVVGALLFSVTKDQGSLHNKVTLNKYLYLKISMALVTLLNQAHREGYT